MGNLIEEKKRPNEGDVAAAASKDQVAAQELKQREVIITV